MSDMVTADEAQRLLDTFTRDLARCADADVWPLYTNAITLAKTVIGLCRRMETMPPWEVSEVPTDEEMYALRLRWAFGPERYQADADSLIAAVMHLRAERDDALRRLDLATETARASDRSLYAIRHAIDGTAVPPPGESLARQVYEVAQREADFATDLRALRAVIDGRATPPSLAEIATHDAAGGRWLVALPSSSVYAPRVFVLDRGVIDVQAYRADVRVTRWWKLDATGRLCAESSGESSAP